MSDELYLIDGNSLAYRAFFALPESIATSKGQPTNAIFGLASMFVKLLSEHGQRPTIVCWDAGSSGRKEIFEEYKGHRPSKPDLLREQWPAFEPLVEAFGWRNAKAEGYEADDVIGTLAERARVAGIPVIVLTGDRDSFQLIDPDSQIRVMATGRGITDTTLYDHAAVTERYGIPPELIPDFYGLKGDSSDNIPGVPGIGDKTAAQLLQQFGSLDEILANVDQISGAKRKENLTNHADDARMSRELARIQRDVPVDLDPTADLDREPDRARLRELFREFELRDPLRRLEETLGEEAGLEGATPAGSTDVAATLTSGGAGEAATFGDVTAPLTVAIHEPPAAEGELFAAQPGLQFGAACGDQVLGGTLSARDELAGALGERPVIAHDAKALGAVPQVLVHDTLLAAYLLDPARRAFPLEELCEERGLRCDLEEPAAREAVLVQELARLQRTELAERDQERLLDEIELPLVHVLRDLELAGVRLNIERLAEIGGRVRLEIDELEREIWRVTGEEFVIASPQQLGAVLFERLGLSRKRRGKTGYSTDARVLQSIRDEHEVIPMIERWRELNQLLKTYLAALPQLVDSESRIHTTFVQALTATGRLSSINPNLQNIPVRTPLGREIRGCFEAAPGNVLVSADYSQVELRVLAHVADEPVLKEIFLQSQDVHTATAREVFGVAESEIDASMRSKAKMINYGIVYGLSDYGLADRLNIPIPEASEFIAAYLTRFSRVRDFMAETIEQATEQGYVTTLFGRRRNIPELRARNGQTRQLGERLAVNTVVQGTAADVMKLAMIGAHRAVAGRGLRSRLLLSIHDELLFEGPPEEAEEVMALAREEMTAPWGDRQPPLEVEGGSGSTWVEAK
ncbi:unannotated protein [freshwater metagenome]|uniref:DNA-directed DNA polymerase n=1 Tax=freshwater metagenome TaxID=449393 RepID=A0A6J7IGZ2_9ZZZZ